MLCILSYAIMNMIRLHRVVIVSVNDSCRSIIRVEPRWYTVSLYWNLPNFSLCWLLLSLLNTTAVRAFIEYHVWTSLTHWRWLAAWLWFIVPLLWKLTFVGFCSDDEREEIIDKVYSAMAEEEKAKKDSTSESKGACFFILYLSLVLSPLLESAILRFYLFEAHSLFGAPTPNFLTSTIYIAVFEKNDSSKE